uniref:BPI2 domain-containing protein n=1 Tax=Panagrellus redivivus TaxID=6233 RepID=A0A7E4UNB9_PANRE
MGRRVLLITYIAILSISVTAQQSSRNTATNTFTPGSTGLRIRLNEPLFTEASSILHSIFSYRVQTVQIPQQQQCFPEGCFALYNLRVTAFRQPRVITLKPLAPNLLLINVVMFDLDILGAVGGNLQLLLTVPVSGGLVINTNSLSLSATIDLQKNQYRQPYLRLASCELRGGFYDAKVTDLGLLTDSINLKYKQEMNAKAREVIQNTICTNLDNIVRTQVNSKLTEIPKAVSLARMLELLDETAPERISSSPIIVSLDESVPARAGPTVVAPRAKHVSTPQQTFTHAVSPVAQPFYYVYYQRQKRQASTVRQGVATITEIGSATPTKKPPTAPIAAKEEGDEDYDLWGHSEGNTSNNKDEILPAGETKEFPAPPPIKHSPKPESGHVHVPSAAKLEPLPQGDAQLSKLLKFINVDNLAKLYVDMDFIDSISGADFFSVGVSGQGFVKGETGAITRSEIAPKRLRFPGRVPRRNVDIVMSEFTPNSLLQQAHKNRLLHLRITEHTPIFGKQLRTSCSHDETCLSDSIPEAAELYPNRQFEALVETVRSPTLTISKEAITIHLVGKTTFYLADTKQTVAKLPFSTDIVVGAVTRGQRLQASISLKNTTILEDLDFFDLSADHLRGFKDAIKGTVESHARKFLANGIDLSILTRRMSTYGLSNFHLEFLQESLILVQADVDVYKLAFDSGDAIRRY